MVVYLDGPTGTYMCRSPSTPPDKRYRGVKALANVIQRCGRCFLLPPTFVYKEFTAGSFVALGFPR
ncbi:hypothetical protein J6590_100083 [Homalodisca vitripennis]|nr:hypothetical protein J6590_100083 [Homalodisca vitripennis]